MPSSDLHNGPEGNFIKARLEHAVEIVQKHWIMIPACASATDTTRRTLFRSMQALGMLVMLDQVIGDSTSVAAEPPFPSLLKKTLIIHRHHCMQSRIHSGVATAVQAPVAIRVPSGRSV